MGYVELTVFRDFVKNTKDGDAEELQAALDAACEYIEDNCGRIAPADVIERVPSGPTLYLDEAIVSLTSITPAGSTVPVDLTTVTPDLGGTTITTTIAEGHDLDVAYRAGYNTPPHWAVMGALIIGKHLWATRIDRPANGLQTDGRGFLVPNQAEAFIGAHRRVGSVA